jgi:hypothetical protein
MPRYFFYLSFGRRVVRDDEGVELPNRSAAWNCVKVGLSLAPDHRQASDLKTSAHRCPPHRTSLLDRLSTDASTVS